MKRVQAIVSGKKKQCTKLPKPALKDKKSSATPESPSTGKARGGAADKEGRDDCGMPAVTASASSTSSTVTVGASSTCSTIAADVSSTHSNIRAGSSSSVSTFSASSPRVTTTKFPGNCPKKGSKDGSSGPSSTKGPQRQDSRGVSKSESFSKKSAKEKQKGSVDVSSCSGQTSSVNESGSKQKMTEEPGYVRQNLYADEGRDESRSDKVSKDDKTHLSPMKEEPTKLASSTASNPHGNHDDKPSQNASLQPVQPKHPNAQTTVNFEQTLNPENSKHNPQTQSQQPLHGILKDSNSNGSSNKNNYQNGSAVYYSSAGAQPREYYAPIGQSPSRTGSLRGPPVPVYQQAYGSLPRNSRSTTPTAENAYSYGSFPRRSNASTPTQPKSFYNGSTEWGTLSQKAESDSGFLTGKADSGRSNYATINYNKPDYRVTGYANDSYGIVNQTYRNDLQRSRPRKVPANYFSDTETGRHLRGNEGYNRGVRAGSVPWGYESDSGAYGSAGRVQQSYGIVLRSYEAGLDYGSGSSSNLRVHPDDEQYRAGPGKRPVPRRHTVGAPGIAIDAKEAETERKREAFLQLLAQRYPQYADRIQGTGSSSTLQTPIPDKPNRSREDQRRRQQALVAYNPNVSGNSLDYDDLGTMTDVEVSSFQRGGFNRSSLPVVRSSSTSLERPLGLVFLVYGDQTKKSLLPNEITSLDTVRALFVRAFPDLTLETLENPRKKIYLLDPATNIYFQLEDLADIKDRSVLKIHETDNDQPQKVKERQEVRGRTVQMPASRSHSFQTYDVHLGPKDMFIKSQSLPPQTAHNYQDTVQDQQNHYERERRSRSRTPEPPERLQRSHSAGVPAKQRFSHSPDRLPTPERLHLNPIPENRQIAIDYVDQGNLYETVGPGTYRGQYPSGIYDSIVPYQSYPTAPPPIPPHQAYVACSSRTFPHRAIQPGMDMRDSARGVNAGRNFIPSDAGFQRSQSYRVPPAERDGKDLSRSHSVTPSDDTARNRIEKMEQQLANLTAWVHYQKDGTRRETIPAPRSLGRATSDSSDTFPASSASKHKGESTPISTIATSTNHVVHSQGLSDADHDASSGKRSSGLSSRESTPVSAHTDISTKLAQLKSDLHVLRKQQQLNMEAMKDEFVATLSKIKKVLSSFPEAENQESFQKRNKATITKSTYVNEKQRVDKELGDIEASVEELRADVISKQCRVNTSDVEGIALLLSNVTKALADLKVRFAEIHGQMKHVLDAEMNILVSEERFLKEEPTELENSLKRCKFISQRLSYLTGLTSGQGESLSHVSRTVLPTDISVVHKNERLVPDYKQGINGKEVSDATHEKMVNTQQDTIKFVVNSETVFRNSQQSSLPGVNGGEEWGMEKRFPAGSRGQSHQEKVASPSVSAVLPVTSQTPMSTIAATQMSTPATLSSVPSTSAASSVVTVKPSFSLASTTTKLSEKPTATVSAMTAGVSDTVTTSAIKTAETESGSPVMKNIVMPLTQTTGRMSSNAIGESETGSLSAKEETKSPKKRDTTVYTYQVCGPVNPVFPIPPVFNNAENVDNTTSSRTSSTEQSSAHLDTPPMDSNSSNTNRSPDLSLSKSDSVKKGTVSFSDPPVTNHPDRNHNINLNSAEKADIATQKQKARNAFFSSLNSSPNSPMSPSRNSANLDPGPVLSPSGVTGKSNQSSTINLVLTGSVSPMSPTSAGSFNISPPVELNLLRSIVSAQAEQEMNSLNDSQSSNSSDASSKQKKVPPPPPPRQGSRPTSASIPPLNGVSPDLTIQQSKEMPRFVGGILGQHRLSGGPLFSTPKSTLQQKPGNEQDSVNGNCINILQSDVQSQTNTSQKNIRFGGDASSVDSNDRGSSSESSSSSGSGTLGSQQSVISVVRSSSLSVKDSNKSKPDPPRRHSSLLAKLTGSKESKNKINNGKAKINGVDF